MAKTAAGSRLFSKILIANRGEIAVRIIQHVPAARDRRPSWSIPRPTPAAWPSRWPTRRCSSARRPPRQSYLVAEKIIDAPARTTGAEAIHPGFGFLSENADFARACADGRHRLHRPQPATPSTRWATRSLPSASRRRPASPSSPGHIGEIDGAAHAAEIADEIGYPVMIKASAGGGGKGIRVVRWRRRDRRGALAPCRPRRAGAFGDDRIFIEKFIVEPAPHRDPGAGRQARPRRPPVRARMLDPAPQPEGHRGGAVAAAGRGHPRGHGRAGRRAGQGGELRLRRHRGVRRRPG